MKVKELRIGSIITLDNKKYYPELKDVPFVIAGIKETLGCENELTYSIDLNPITIPTNRYYETYSQFLEFIKPIELTGEWLVKFGFYKRLNDAGVCNMFSYRKKIKTTWSSYLYFIIDDENKSICSFDIRDIEAYKYEYKAKQTTYPVNNNTVKYVHQLQNIYFALTGQELTLK